MPTTSVRRRISRLSRSWGLLDQICRQMALGNAGEGQDVGAGGVQVRGDLRQLLLQGVQDPAELGVHRSGVGLVIDRVQQGPHPAPRRFRGHAHQVGGVMGAAPLPRGTGQRRADRLGQPAVGVGGDQGDTGQAAGGQIPEERQPPGAVLGAGDVQAQDLPVPLRVHPGRQQGVHIHDPPSPPGPSAPGRPRRRRYRARRPAAGSGTPPPARPGPWPSH